MAERWSWKLEARLPAATLAERLNRRDASIASAVRDGTRLAGSAADSLRVTSRDASLVMYASRNDVFERGRRELDVVLAQHHITAQVTIAHQSNTTTSWQVTAGPYQAPRTRHGGRRDHQDRRPLVSAHAKKRWVAAFTIAAAIGASLYAVSPGVLATQIGLPLTFPLLFAVLVWLHHRLPILLQWAIAIPLAAAGPICYLIFNGSQLWAWGQLAVFPLLGLLFHHAFVKGAMRPRSKGPWYGGPMQGPFGPP